MRVTALAGRHRRRQAAARPRAPVSAPRDLTIIGNTGDDTEVWGLHVSPDLDTVTYALAGLLDVARGWGRADETFRCLEAMAALGGADVVQPRRPRSRHAPRRAPRRCARARRCRR